MAGSVPAELVALAHRLADAARPIAARYFRTAVTVDDKTDQSPVTIADREAETAMRDLLGTEVPRHGVFGEEHGAVRTDADYVWVLDPIDGTKAYITGLPIFGTLIALLHRGKPVLGIIDQPILGERWLAHGDEPTTLNGRPVRVRACEGTAQATVYTSGLEYWRDDARAAFDRLYERCRLMRFSADCYAVGLLACGFVDLVVEAGMHPHDYAALVPIVENAGGVVTDFAGRPLDFVSRSGVICAGDRRAHAEAVALLATAA